MLKIILIMSIMILSAPSKAQQLDRNKTVCAYVYNFVKLVEWPNNEKFNNFNILIISNDNLLINEFRNTFKTANTKGKPINILSSDTPPITLNDIQLILVTQDKSNIYLETFDKVENKPILLISENYPDKRLVMINLYDTPDKNLNFEINKSNIANQNLIVNDEILLAGGTQIDIADLYKKSQFSLRYYQKTLLQYEQSLDSVTQQLKIIKEHINEKEFVISSQNNLIETQKSNLSSLSLLTRKQSYVLFEQKHSLNNQLTKLKCAEKGLLQLKDSINARYSELTSKRREINVLDSVILVNSKILIQQSKTINRQKQAVVLFAIISLLTLILIILIYTSYKRIKSINKKLNENKKEIESINEELTTTNDLLNDKNNELIDTLEKLEGAKEQLIQSEKMASLGILTAGIAHEMNNPINFVYAGVSSLSNDIADLITIINELKRLNPYSDNLTEVLENIKQLNNEYNIEETVQSITQTIDDIKLGAHRSAEIIKGLRNFSRSNDTEKQLANIHESINDALVLLSDKYKRNIEIIKQFDNNIPLIACFSGKLGQVFVNIISNAIDAIDSKGKIIITTLLEAQHIVIKIKDNGNGMDNETKSKIFDPFFTTKQIGKGLGLGLSITYGIIKEHNGEISCISEPFKGTEFEIRIPLV